MELIEYKTTRRFSKENPTIVITKKGLISFSASAVEKLNLKPGDKIAFYQDKNTINWYLKVNEEGATLRNHYDSNSNGLMCNFSIVAQRILKSLNKDEGVTIKVATIPENGMYAILTRSI